MTKLIAKKERKFLFITYLPKELVKNFIKNLSKNFKKFTIVIHNIRISKNVQSVQWSQPDIFFSFSCNAVCDRSFIFSIFPSCSSNKQQKQIVFQVIFFFSET